MLANNFFKLSMCAYDDSLKTLFRTRSQACQAIVTTIWRPGLFNMIYESVES